MSITGVTINVYVTADTLLSPQTVSLILSLLVNLSAVYRGHDDGIEQKFSPSHKIKVSILKVPLRFWSTCDCNPSLSVRRGGRAG